MDREYAICYRTAQSGLAETNSGETTLRGAQKVARGMAKDGCYDITIKLYDDGDLQHQWDLKDGKFTQYE